VRLLRVARTIAISTIRHRRRGRSGGGAAAYERMRSARRDHRRDIRHLQHARDIGLERRARGTIRRSAPASSMRDNTHGGPAGTPPALRENTPRCTPRARPARPRESFWAWITARQLQPARTASLTESRPSSCPGARAGPGPPSHPISFLTSTWPSRLRHADGWQPQPEATCFSCARRCAARRRTSRPARGLPLAGTTASAGPRPRGARTFQRHQPLDVLDATQGRPQLPDVEGLLPSLTLR
jgi:hypothetical protein